MNDFNKISVIIPAFNEELNITPLVNNFKELPYKILEKIEVIIVDDGSTDNTLTEIKKSAQENEFVKFAIHRKNYGMTEALLTGFKQSIGDIIIIYPSDLQYLPKDIPCLIEGFEDGYDIVTGWKKGKYEKKLISFFYNWLSRKIFKLKVHDLNSVKALRREVFKDLRLRKDWHRYIIVLAAEMGYKIKEVRMNLYPRLTGKSKFSGKKRIAIGILDLLSVKFFISFSKKPLLLFGSSGALFLFFGLVLGIIEIILRFGFELGFRPILYLVMLLVMVGITLFALGFIAELIVILIERLQEMVKISTNQLLDKKNTGIDE